MKNLTVESTSLFMNIDCPVVLGDGGVKLTIIFQIIGYLDNNDKLAFEEVEVMDYKNVSFMGMDIGEGFQSFNKFKENLESMGVDFDGMIDKKVNEVESDVREFGMGEIKKLLK